jgi:hypothetical protein
MQTNLRFDRLYADAEGQSHFAPFEVAVTLREFAPPAPPFSVSALDPASRCGFLHLPIGWQGELHRSPMRMWIFVLAGEMEFKATDGAVRTISPGSALLLEDTIGLGHTSRVLGQLPATLAAIQLPGREDAA